MLPAQPADIRVVCLEDPEIRNRRRETLARPQVTSGVTVAAGSGLGEREIDHRPQQQCRRERVFTREGIRRGRQNLVVIAVQLLRSFHHDPRRSVQRRPGHEEQDGLKQITISLRMTQGPLYSLEIIEIWKSLQIITQMPR